jgi:hypothetical protein
VNAMDMIPRPTWWRPPKPWSSSRYLAYREYMCSPEWMSLRDKVLKERGHRCEFCGSAMGRLEIHHVTYVRIGQELMDDLRVLCRFCHAKEHRRKA